ncbi:hypothetical protein [Aquimarina agarilytica]|uniref:hypothetical protein n=1 Tax=Aquimarina agarilytica TaxID=1087449 RepID=UPI0002E14615|nr:hypothetical protein [Aquimarina agarilytica]
MKYLNPQIEKLAKKNVEKSLVKKGISCGIFQELGVDTSNQKTRNLYHDNY